MISNRRLAVRNWNLKIGCMIGYMLLIACHLQVNAQSIAGRFQRVDVESVKDTRTGLIWRRCTATQALPNCDYQAPNPDVANLPNWPFIAYHQINLYQRTQAGWRLPSVKELFSLLDLERSSNFHEEFPNSPPAWFRVSTPTPFMPDVWWNYCINFNPGDDFYGSVQFRFQEGLEGCAIRLVR
jgi:Protein of unknown function (DUF1566)